MSRRSLLRVAWWQAIAVAVMQAACGAGLREPPTTDHAPGDYVSVPYLPPAALVEGAGEPPSDDCVWTDGHWTWRGGNYVWKRGGWVRPAQGLFYAPWGAKFTEDSRPLFAEGSWYDAAGRRVPPPEIVRSARTPPNEVTSEFESPR